MRDLGFDPEFAAASDWARLYRANGVQVVPAKCHLEVRKGQSWKCPLLKTWAEFQNALVPNEIFDRWYGPHGQYVSRLNMGVLTGRCSGNLFVIDLDLYKTPAALDWWVGLMAVHNNDMDLETVEQVTGGGGSQKLFHAPAHWTAPTNKTTIGVDIRGQGGFAMLTPSLHESGNAYHWAEGHSPDDIPITMAPDWLLEAVVELVQKYGGVTTGTAGNGQSDRTSIGGQFDAFGHQTDGRETVMYRMVWRCVVDWRRQCPIKPGDGESAQKAQHEYGVYERNTRPQQPHPADMTLTQMLDAEGRGWMVWWVKWQYAMKQWEDDVTIAARQPDPKPNTGYTDYTDEYAKQNNNPSQAPASDRLPYPVLSVDDIMDRPDPVWAIDGLIGERTLGFIFGAPGSLKTFIAIDIALSIVTKAAAWWGRPVKTTGAVVYLCREGTRSLKFRIKAWEIHRKCGARGTPFRLVEHPTNFMVEDDVWRVIATIKAVKEETGGPIAAVFVDTVSRVLPGAEENLQRDMSLFTGACEHIQMIFNCLVIGVHHTNKNGGIRGSTVIPGAGDFLLGTKRETGQMTGSIFVEKVKDGTDGYEIPFKATKIEGLGGIVPQSSLVVDGIDPSAAGPTDRYEGGSSDGAKRRDILQALHEAWEVKKPWGVREAIEIIMVRWRIPPKDAKQLLLDWRGFQVIEYAVYNTDTKAKGYRKLKDI